MNDRKGSRVRANRPKIATADSRSSFFPLPFESSNFSVRRLDIRDRSVDRCTRARRALHQLTKQPLCSYVFLSRIRSVTYTCPRLRSGNRPNLCGSCREQGVDSCLMLWRRMRSISASNCGRSFARESCRLAPAFLLPNVDFSNFIICLRCLRFLATSVRNSISRVCRKALSAVVRLIPIPASCERRQRIET